MEVFKATGDNHIEVDRPGQGAVPGLSGKVYLIFPKEGETYDFTDYEYAWVCGRQYETVRHGLSHPINVAGRKIKIVSVKKGDAWDFAVIKFVIL